MKPVPPRISSVPGLAAVANAAGIAALAAAQAPVTRTSRRVGMVRSPVPGCARDVSMREAAGANRTGNPVAPASGVQSAEVLALPPRHGSFKEVPVKSLSILLASAWLALGAIAVVAADSNENSVNGTWGLNVAKSKFSGPGFKSQTRTYAVAADGTTTMSFTGYHEHGRHGQRVHPASSTTARTIRSRARAISIRSPERRSTTRRSISGSRSRASSWARVRARSRSTARS